MFFSIVSPTSRSHSWHSTPNVDPNWNGTQFPADPALTSPVDVTVAVAHPASTNVTSLPAEVRPMRSDTDTPLAGPVPLLATWML